MSKKEGGISLRTIHLCLIVGSIVICSLTLFATYQLSKGFWHLKETSDLQIELRKAAAELMEASDYLTEKVQRFSVLGDRTYLNEYFEEAFTAHHREEAIERMSVDDRSADALKELQAAMEVSVGLMEREYYAMKLVIEAKGITEYPEILRSVELSAEERTLSPDEKMRRAALMVHDDEYYAQKDVIREKMKSSLSALEKMAYDTDESALNSLRDELNLVRIAIILQTIGIIFMVWMTSRLGIHPVLNAVERIKEDSPIPEVGANEFRYLARAYNKMYEVYKTSLEHLNFKASHDELTGAYNRAGYDLLLSSIDMSSTYMLLFDLDNFKNINDTYGHETGDKVLIRLVEVLKSFFRDDDYVCRIGGDEFVVFMVHAAKVHQNLIAQKIEKINKKLSESEDGLPPISVSVGIAHGADAKNGENLFEKTDKAMYRAKQSGKQTYSFSSREDR